MQWDTDDKSKAEFEIWFQNFHVFYFRTCLLIANRAFGEQSKIATE